MFLLIATIFSLTCFSLTYCESAETVKVPDYLFQNSRLYGHPGGRQRRSFANHIFGKAAVRQGRELMEFLTQNAVRVPPNGFINHRRYLKHGGYRQALADFTALQPDDIHSVRQTGNVIARTGSVGDRTVYVSTGGPGSGRAKVTVVKTWNDLDTEVDQFIYLD